MATLLTEISRVRCFLCRRKIAAPRDKKHIDNSTCPTSKKSFREVLLYLAKHANSELHIATGESVCSSCHFEIVEYDTYLMKALKKQRILLDLIDKAITGFDSDFENDIIPDTSALDELTDDHFFDDADVSDNEIERTIDDAMDDDDDRTEAIIGRPRKDREYKIKCDFCAMKFRTKQNLHKHVSNVHKKFTCELCPYSHRNEDYVKLHMNTHEGKNENQCRDCGKEFTSKMSVIRHMEAHYDSRKYQCDKCGLCFSQTTVLYNHKLQHEAEEQPLQCDICTQVFKTKRTYRRHMITHRADRPRYSCDYCSKTFTEKYTLKIHKRTHPEAVESSEVKQPQQQISSQENDESTYAPPKTPPQESKFNCIICEQVFTVKDHLNKHMEKEHDVILKSLTINNFTEYDEVDESSKKSCNICGQIFSAQPNLDYHLKYVHTNTF
ncbi:serendipity locus protein beta-like [Eurosta solidaginis]|uniref:serendipity locus protein beta-like n=1 Tax=Eurosta solidaginis TaxID=178769 RepID=UPI0035313CCB